MYFAGNIVCGGSTEVALHLAHFLLCSEIVKSLWLVDIRHYLSLSYSRAIAWIVGNAPEQALHWFGVLHAKVDPGHASEKWRQRWFLRSTLQQHRNYRATSVDKFA